NAKLPDWMVIAHQVSPEEHIKMQAAVQKYTCLSVSKTCNMPNSATKKDVAEVLVEAYKSGCKGTTIYRDGSREQQVMYTDKTPKPKTARQRERGDSMSGVTVRKKTGCGRMYITLNSDADGLFEVFARGSKHGGCIGAQLEAIGRCISVGLQSGNDPREYIKQLRSIKCGEVEAGVKKGKATSCADAIAKVITEHLDKTKMPSDIGPDISVTACCPECGAKLINEEGCMACGSCDYRKCL
ncbi:unnamed protein product, partial [marine sediment metagenome]